MSSKMCHRPITLREYIQGHQALKKSQSSHLIAHSSNKIDKINTKMLFQEIGEKFIEIKKSLKGQNFQKHKIVWLLYDLENAVNQIATRFQENQEIPTLQQSQQNQPQKDLKQKVQKKMSKNKTLKQKVRRSLTIQDEPQFILSSQQIKQNHKSLTSLNDLSDLDTIMEKQRPNKKLGLPQISETDELKALNNEEKIDFGQQKQKVDCLNPQRMERIGKHSRKRSGYLEIDNRNKSKVF